MRPVLSFNVSIGNYRIRFLICSEIKQSVVQYQLAVAGVLADIQELYYRIERVSSVLRQFHIDIGDLPSLHVPSLHLPELRIDWQMPRTI